MRLSRPCYDKIHRCPGWAGGGFRYARRNRCDGGSLLVPGSWNREGSGTVPEDRWWRWRFYRCRKCDVLTLPYMSRWADPAWIRWVLVRRFR